jgi:hypothetical protein
MFWSVQMKVRSCAMACVSLLLLAGCAAVPQPYAGQDARDIRALSPQEIDQYRSGAGMGFARAAELNHFPGPLHALELADRLELSTAQRAAIRELMEAHRVEARAAGAQVIEAERSLDAMFRSGSDRSTLMKSSIDVATLTSSTDAASLTSSTDAATLASSIDAAMLASRVEAAARAQGAYRLTHLETHRRMRSILSDEQVARYDALRGYGSATEQSHRH